jgi:hypothetical protein
MPEANAPNGPVRRFRNFEMKRHAGCEDNLFPIFCAIANAASADPWQTAAMTFTQAVRSRRTDSFISDRRFNV